MTVFDFSFLTAGSKTIVVHPALNVTPYYYARLIVRVHQIDIASGGARSIKVGGYGIDPSRDDSQEFVLSSSTLEVTINSATSVGLQSDTDTDLYPFLKMYVTGTYDTTTAKLYAVLSADLLLREA
ncbi:hypothetical protein ACNOYE_20785 [Nannocystaceae bacterium ST9]